MKKLLHAGLFALFLLPIVGVSMVASAQSTSIPTVTSITPTQGSENATVTIYGTNLSGASSVDFYNSSGQHVAGMGAPSISLINSTSLTFTVDGIFAANVAAGTYKVKVVTPSGTSNGSSFTLIAPSASIPTISSINPSQGSENATVTIYGTNLPAGATSVEFYNSNNQIVASIPATHVSANGTQVRFTLGNQFVAMLGAGTYQMGVMTNVCPGGCSSNRVSFTLTTQQVPTVDLKVNNSDGPLTKSAGYSTFSWTSTNSDYCTASGDTYWSGTKSTSGSETVWTGNEKTGVTTYSITCGASSGKVNPASNSVTVSFASGSSAPLNVVATPQAPTTQITPSFTSNQTTLNATTQAVSDCLPGHLFSLTTGKQCAARNTTTTGATPVITTSGADVDTSSQASSCVDLSNNMRYRMRDSQTNNEVTDLQDFLNTKGYLASQPTGYFGLATLRAVKAYQSSTGLSPTGFVGPLTRAKIKAETCS